MDPGSSPPCSHAQAEALGCMMMDVLGCIHSCCKVDTTPIILTKDAQWLILNDATRTHALYEDHDHNKRRPDHHLVFVWQSWLQGCQTIHLVCSADVRAAVCRGFGREGRAVGARAAEGPRRRKADCSRRLASTNHNPCCRPPRCLVCVYLRRGVRRTSQRMWLGWIGFQHASLHPPTCIPTSDLSIAYILHQLLIYSTRLYVAPSPLSDGRFGNHFGHRHYSYASQWLPSKENSSDLITSVQSGVSLKVPECLEFSIVCAHTLSPPLFRFSAKMLPY